MKDFDNAIIVLLGPPGVGKGTQAAKFAAEFGFSHISTGDLLRAELKKDSDIGRRASDYIKSGKLVPDEVIAELVAQRIQEGGNLILDGFPRNLAQAELLDDLLKDSPQAISAAALFDAEYETLRERIAKRAICGACGANHSGGANGACVKCGGEIIVRQDDDLSTFRERFHTYNSQTAPLIEYYERSGLVAKIDATQPIDAVYEELKLNLAGAAR